MPSLLSPVKAIDDLFFRSWTKAIPAGKPVTFDMVRVENLVVIRLPDGTLACNQLQDYAYVPAKWPWTADLMKALVAMGVITQVQADEHQSVCKRLADKRSAELDTDTLSRIVSKYGVDALDLRAEIKRQAGKP